MGMLVSINLETQKLYKEVWSKESIIIKERKDEFERQF